MTRNYSELYDSGDAEMLQDMDDTITKLELWDWMKTYEPEDGKGFMFSNHPNLDLIHKTMKYGGHSGSSYGWTMRQIEFVAKHGWDKFRYKRLATIQYKQTDRYEMIQHNLNVAYRTRDNDMIEIFEEKMTKDIQQIAEKLEQQNKPKPILFPSYGDTCPCRKAKGLTGWCGVAGGGVPGCEH